MNFNRNHTNDALGFQIAPMLDVVFLLLCFFVTSQIFAKWESEIDIQLPTATTGEIPQRLPGEVIINVQPSGSTIVNGRVLDPQELQEMVQRLAQLFPGQPVLIRADRATDFEHVMKVLDACRQADLSNISFATLTPGSAL